MSSATPSVVAGNPINWPTSWRRPPQLIRSRAWRYALLLAAVGYLVVGIGSVDVNWVRVSDGMNRGARFVSGFLAPDFTTRWRDISQGLIESLAMAFTSTVAGVLISIPVGIGAARNISPSWAYGLCRGIIAISRSLQEIIVAILLVAFFGFGAFAGFLTLTFATIGFIGKLLADDIEECDPRQIEATRATGASWLQLLNYAVQPQVMPRMIGLSVYRLDINFRESAVIGIVGAGGIGGTLDTALSRYEYDSAGAILIIIIAIVMVSEYASSQMRGRMK